MGFVKSLINESMVLDAGSGYEKYEWSTGDTNQTLQVGISMGYGIHQISVKVYNQYWCSSSDTIIIAISNATSVNGTLDNKTFIYPNPTDQYIYIDTETDYSTVRIVDLLGKVIYEADKKNYINLNSVKPGT